MNGRDRILEKLREGNVAIDEAAAAVHVHWVTASKYIKQARDAGVVHISGWRQSTNGNPAALYTFGPGRNKRKPKALTPPEKCARWREKNRGLIVARRHASKQPANPFAGLYLGMKT